MGGGGREDPGEGVQDTHQAGQSEEGEGLLGLGVSGEVGEGEESQSEVLEVSVQFG